MSIGANGHSNKTREQQTLVIRNNRRQFVRGLKLRLGAAKVFQSTVYQKHNSLLTRKGTYRG